MFFENGFRIADRQAVIRKVFRTAAGPRVFAETGLEHIPIMIILQYEANRPHIVHLIPNAMKTEMLVLFALALLGTAEKATAQAADKKAARKEKKELRQSIDRARHQQALDAILDSAFVLQANAVLLENYPREQVDFHRNFVSMEGGHFSIQMSGIAANPVLKTGGEVSRMRIRTDKKGFVRCRIDLSGIVMTSSTVYLTLYPDSNEATATVRSLRGGRGVTLEGVIVPAAMPRCSGISRLTDCPRRTGPGNPPIRLRSDSPKSPGLRFSLHRLHERGGANIKNRSERVDRFQFAITTSGHKSGQRFRATIEKSRPAPPP